MFLLMVLCYFVFIFEIGHLHLTFWLLWSLIRNPQCNRGAFIHRLRTNLKPFKTLHMNKLLPTELCLLYTVLSSIAYRTCKEQLTFAFFILLTHHMLIYHISREMYFIKRFDLLWLDFPTFRTSPWPTIGQSIGGNYVPKLPFGLKPPEDHLAMRGKCVSL